MSGELSGSTPYRRNIPDVEYKVGKQTLTLTFNSAMICEFDPPNEHFSHVYVEPENLDAEPMYIFGDLELRDTLHKELYRSSVEPYPNDAEVQQYKKWQGSILKVIMDV